METFQMNVARVVAQAEFFGDKPNEVQAHYLKVEVFSDYGRICQMALIEVQQRAELFRTVLLCRTFYKTGYADGIIHGSAAETPVTYLLFILW
jgi:hypothetical protein